MNRDIPFIWLAKMGMRMSRLLGKGVGSSFPGMIIRRVSPRFLWFNAPSFSKGVALVTGTNGKSTTTHMIAKSMARSGKNCAYNKSGANLINGLATTIIENMDNFGHSKAQSLVLEVDEATMPQAVEETNPCMMVVTNIFPDQLDRYGEITATAGMIKDSFYKASPNTKVVLNADDPLSASLGEEIGLDVIYYGLEAPEIGRKTGNSLYCMHCGKYLYQYKMHYYSFLGDYYCPYCDHKRLLPQVYARQIKLKGIKGSSFELVTPDHVTRIDLKVPGIYNIYNALAATATCIAWGIPLKTIKQSLEAYATVFGRMEEIKIQDKKLYLSLVKNTAGFNEALRVWQDDNEPAHLCIAIHDTVADGQDVSWLWDVDFEGFIERHVLKSVVVTGHRAADLALRLKYAGVDYNMINIEKDCKKAINLSVSLCDHNERLFVFPNYSAMFEVRSALEKEGYVEPIWEKG